MWYHPELNIKAATHSEIRSACPQVSFPANMTDENIAYAGFVLYVETPEEIQANQAKAYQDSIPKSISHAQGKAALINAGLWSAVVSYVEAIADPLQKALAEVALYDTQEWKRTSPFLNTAATALGLTAEQVDALFIAGGQIDF